MQSFHHGSHWIGICFLSLSPMDLMVVSVSVYVCVCVYFGKTPMDTGNGLIVKWKVKGKTERQASLINGYNFILFYISKRKVHWQNMVTDV